MDPILLKQLGEWRLEEMRRDARRRASRAPLESRQEQRPKLPSGAMRQAILALWRGRTFRAG